MTNVQPLPGVLRTSMSPPCALTALRAIDSPKPSPVRFFARRSPNGRNSSPVPAGIPPQESCTSIATRVPFARARMTTLPPRGEYLKALLNKFVTADASSC